MKTTLYLARHGETQWNKIQRFQGQLDSELTYIGQQQSDQLAQSLITSSIHLIVSSGLGRAKTTAKICQQTLNRDVLIDNDLAERNLGEWQGRTLASLQQDPLYIDVLQGYTNISPPLGESAKQCGYRIYQSLKSIAKQAPNKKLLIIFHGEALRCFLLFIQHKLVGNAYELFSNGSAFPLQFCHTTCCFESYSSNQESNKELAIC